MELVSWCGYELTTARIFEKNDLIPEVKKRLSDTESVEYGTYRSTTSSPNYI